MGYRSSILYHLFHLLYSWGLQPVNLISCENSCSILSGFLQPPLTTYTFPTPPYIFIYMLSPFFDCATCTGESSFPLPSSIVFTSENPLNLLPPHPSTVHSIFSALCVLLQSSNFPFDFGGNAFFTNQRGSQPAPLHPPKSSSSTPPSLLLSLLPVPSLLSLPVLAPLGPPGQRGDKGAPIISLLVLIWAAQGFQVPPITPRNIITSSPGNTVSLPHTLMHTHTHAQTIIYGSLEILTDCTCTINTSWYTANSGVQVANVHTHGEKQNTK